MALKERLEYVLCARCESDYTSNFKWMLCSSCEDEIRLEWEKYENKDYKNLIYGKEFYDKFSCLNDIFENYEQSGEMVFVNDNLKLMKDVFKEEFKGVGGVYHLVLEFLLSNDMIDKELHNKWFDNNDNDSIDDLNTKIELLTFALNDVEDMLDDNTNNRELGQFRMARREVYLKYIRHLIEVYLYELNERLGEK